MRFSASSWHRKDNLFRKATLDIIPMPQNSQNENLLSTLRPAFDIRKHRPNPILQTSTQNQSMEAQKGQRHCGRASVV